LLASIDSPAWLSSSVYVGKFAASFQTPTFGPSTLTGAPAWQPGQSSKSSNSATVGPTAPKPEPATVIDCPRASSPDTPVIDPASAGTAPSAAVASVTDAARRGPARRTARAPVAL
jgi:hypothetical protein